MRLDFNWLQADWPAPRNICTASTVRSGGVSVPPFDTLNLGAHVGDVPEAVRENRQRLHQALQLPSEPCWLEQVHGTAVVEAGEWSTPPQADACIARSPGQVCVVMTADCLPVLFCSREGDRVAAAHAGWRGLAGGVLESTVSSLGLPGSALLAWLGPAIGPQEFEVGDEVRIAFMARDAAAMQAFRPGYRPGHWLADLYLLARQDLARLGVAAVYGGGWCTVRDATRFFSYRRDGQTGRMASLIWMD
jgi:purine-nucleoside/S-methyl-5'-thioadenosine phosphorylase / adenosine deaminase